MKNNGQKVFELKQTDRQIVKQTDNCIFSYIKVLKNAKEMNKSDLHASDDIKASQKYLCPKFPTSIDHETHYPKCVANLQNHSKLKLIIIRFNKNGI